MPALMVILVLLLVVAMFLEGFTEAWTFLFVPDFSKLTWHGILEAVGHSFFTLSLGMGAMITYGSYINKGEPIVKSAILIALLDTLIALLAGLIIFTVVYTFGGEPKSGPSLMFVTATSIQKTYGRIYPSDSFLYVIWLCGAYLGSSFLLEVVVSAMENREHWSRKKATFISAAIIWSLGVLCALSFNVLADFKPIMNMTMFDLFDTLSGKIFLPLGGLLIAVFFGWSWKTAAEGVELRGAKYKVLLWTNRVVAPIAIAYVLYNGLIAM